MLSWWVCKCCSRPSGCGCDADASPTGYDRINRRIQSIPPFDTATINVWWMRYRPYRLYFHPSIHPSIHPFLSLFLLSFSMLIHSASEWNPFCGPGTTNSGRLLSPFNKNPRHFPIQLLSTLEVRFNDVWLNGIGFNGSNETWRRLSTSLNGCILFTAGIDGFLFQRSIWSNQWNRVIGSFNYLLLASREMSFIRVLIGFRTVVKCGWHNTNDKSAAPLNRPEIHLTHQSNE